MRFGTIVRCTVAIKEEAQAKAEAKDNIWLRGGNFGSGRGVS